MKKLSTRQNTPAIFYTARLVSTQSSPTYANYPMHSFIGFVLFMRITEISQKLDSATKVRPSHTIQLGGQAPEIFAMRLKPRWWWWIDPNVEVIDVTVADTITSIYKR